MSNANDILVWEQFGYNYGDRFIALGSTSLYVNETPSLKHVIYYSLKNKIGLSGINMSDSICKDYIEVIRRKSVRFIYGYASSIYLLAKYVLLNNESLRIQACFSTSEVLTDLFRKTIKEAFQCEVVDCYGAHDGGISAYAGKNDFFKVGYNCLVRMEGSKQNGCSPALLTDLFNFAMPFINYKVGDEILMDETNNNCQYNGQIINKVIGRSSDFIQLENGCTLTGAGFTVLFKDLPVEHYTVKKNGPNSIECSIVRLPGFDRSHESLIRETFKKQIGGNTRFSIVYVDTITTTQSGKRKYFINE
jgi:phenylacetate-CoA ligase